MTAPLIAPYADKTTGQTMLGSKIGWKEAGGQKGRGIFALEFIAKGTIVEVAPVVLVAASAIPDEGGAPDGYLFDWEPDEEGREHCMPIGYLMLINHNPNPNISLENDHEEMTITSTASRDIHVGDELTWNYNCDIWFDED